MPVRQGSLPRDQREDALASSPIRVALDTTFAGVNRTGVGIYSRELGRHLRQKQRSAGLAVRCYGPACRPLELMGGIVHTAQEWPVYTHGVLPLSLLGFRPDVVHSTSHIGPLWGTGKKIITVHDIIFMRYPQEYNPWWLAITRAVLPPVLANASAVVTDSHATRVDLAHYFGVRRKVRVIYPGISKTGLPAEVGVVSSQSTDATPNPYILCVGPWVERKNLRVVLEAFSHLAYEHTNVDLVITGDPPRGMSSGGPREILDRMPPEVRDRVQLVGHVSRNKLMELLGGAALLAYPSRFEGFGLPPLEAMSLGVPVVAANSPAVAEVTGGAALLVPPDDVSRWADCITLMLTDATRREEARKAGLVRSALFTWDRCADETITLYRQVLRAESWR